MGDLPVKDIAAKGPGYVFGPVPSGRLGLSLGLDLVPKKTCTLDCLYCEVGRTTNRTVRRSRAHPAEDVLEELAAFLPEWEERLDYITLAGSGEPTLNAGIGQIIDEVKAMTSVSLAVLTNGTLLNREDVRQDLAKADVVLPSLDTCREETFRLLNRPHPDLDLPAVIKGLTRFRAGFGGRVWLEVLLAAGINDRPEELEALALAVDEIKPDKVQLNTVYRPPADGRAQPLGPDELAAAAGFFRQRVEVAARFSKDRKKADPGRIGLEVLSLLGRRPCTREDVADALGLSAKRVSRELGRLEQSGLIRFEEHDEKLFFRRVDRRPPGRN